MESMGFQKILIFSFLVAQGTIVAYCDEQLFFGIAEMEVKGEFDPTTGTALQEIQNSIENAILLSVSDIQVILIKTSDKLAESSNLTLSFHGYTDNLKEIPACLTYDYMSSESSAFSYLYKSLLIQSFYNISAIAEECYARNKTIAYIEYFETNCLFPSLDCEPRDLLPAVQYNLYGQGSILRSFYCTDIPSDCIVEWEENHDCFVFNWKPRCELDYVSVSDPTDQSLDMLEKYFGRLLDKSQIDDLFQEWSCIDIFVSGVGPPILTLQGDPTWVLLPEWFQVCLRVLNGIAFASLLICLVTFAVFRELRNAYGRNALSLVVAIMASLFYSSGYIPLETDDPQLCVFIGTLLYYFAVLPSYWWTAVAVFLAWTLGRRGIHRMESSSGTGFFLLLSLFGWGVPLILTVFMLIIHVSGVQVFNITDHCWISSGWPVLVVTVETLVPFIVDCVLFCLVVFRVRQTRREMKTLNKTKSFNSANDRQLTIKVQILVILDSLLDMFNKAVTLIGWCFSSDKLQNQNWKRDTRYLYQYYIQRYSIL